jgi:hypothetical protein
MKRNIDILSCVAWLFLLACALFAFHGGPGGSLPAFAEEEKQPFVLPAWAQKGSGVFLVDDMLIVRGVGKSQFTDPLGPDSIRAITRVYAEICRQFEEIWATGAVTFTDTQGNIESHAIDPMNALLDIPELSLKFMIRDSEGKMVYALAEVDLIRIETKENLDEQADQKNQQQPSTLPAWVTAGSGLFEIEGKLVVRGVVQTDVTGNIMFAIRMAEDKARAEIGRQINLLSETTTVKVIDAEGNIEIQTISREFTDVVLTGVEVIDSYVDEDNDALYVVAEMKL